MGWPEMRLSYLEWDGNCPSNVVISSDRYWPGNSESNEIYFKFGSKFGFAKKKRRNKNCH